MSWLNKILPKRIQITPTSNRRVPEGVWNKCEKCDAVLYNLDLERSFHVCPRCGYHKRLAGRKRLEYFLDADSMTEIGVNIDPDDALKFKDSKKYKDRISQAQKKTAENEALVAMAGTLHGRPIAAAAFEFGFIGGSMGSVVGERFVRAVNWACEHRTAFVCFSTSGGARMQEGALSLMQMAKTSAALAKLQQEKLPFISILCDPTYGGVTASLAMLGDVIIAEPQALIGFTGPRVIEQTVRETLPKGFQTSEFLLEHGFIDCITPRSELSDTVARLLAKFFHHPVDLSLRMSSASSGEQKSQAEKNTQGENSSDNNSVSENFSEKSDFDYKNEPKDVSISNNTDSNSAENK